METRFELWGVFQLDELLQLFCLSSPFVLCTLRSDDSQFNKLHSFTSPPINLTLDGGVIDEGDEQLICQCAEEVNGRQPMAEGCLQCSWRKWLVSCFKSSHSLSIVQIFHSCFCYSWKSSHYLSSLFPLPLQQTGMFLNEGKDSWHHIANGGIC